MSDQATQERTSFFSKVASGLRNAIVEEDVTKPAPPPPVAPVISQPIVGSFSLPPQPSSIRKEVVDAIRTNALARATAYTNLLQMADSMASVIPDPNTRIKAAWTIMAKDPSRSVSKTIQAIDTHINDADGQALIFAQQSQRRRAEQVSPLQAQLKAAQDEEASAKARIAELNERLSQLAVTTSTLSPQIVDFEAKIAADEAEFATAVQIVKTELENSKTVVGTALGDK